LSTAKKPEATLGIGVETAPKTQRAGTPQARQSLLLENYVTSARARPHPTIAGKPPF